jgi:hypothetical protein
VLVDFEDTGRGCAVSGSPDQAPKRESRAPDIACSGGG